MKTAVGPVYDNRDPAGFGWLSQRAGSHSSNGDARPRYTTLESVKRRRSQSQYRVFFSYSHKDRWIARQCVRLIEEKGSGRIKVFLDEKDIDAGQSIADSVRANIEACDEFVVLLTRYSKDRPWVLIEMGAAWGLKRPMIAIIDKIGPKEMPDIVSPYKAVDLNDFDQYLEQLSKRVKAGRRR